MSDIEKLFDAIKGGDAEVVGQLLKDDPRLVHERHDGKTALEYANELENKAAIKLLTDAAKERAAKEATETQAPASPPASPVASGVATPTTSTSASPTTPTTPTDEDAPVDHESDQAVKAHDGLHDEEHKENVPPLLAPKTFLQEIGTNPLLAGGLAAMATVLISGVSGLGGGLMALVVGITAAFTLPKVTGSFLDVPTPEKLKQHVGHQLDMHGQAQGQARDQEVSTQAIAGDDGIASDDELKKIVGENHDALKMAKKLLVDAGGKNTGTAVDLSALGPQFSLPKAEKTEKAEHGATH